MAVGTRDTELPVTSAGRVRKAVTAPYWLLLVLAVAAVACSTYLTRAYVMDDTLITLRYSLNLARLGRPVWNQADVNNPSMGYTTIMWMLLNAVPALFTQHRDTLVAACKFLVAFPLGGILVIFVNKIRELSLPRAAGLLTVLLLFSQPLYGLHLNTGMETLLYSFLILLAVHSYTKAANRYVPYLVGIAAFLTRPEGAILVGLMFCNDMVQRRRKEAILGALGFAIVLMIVTLVLYDIYGSVLPNAFYIKQGLGIINLDSVRDTIWFLTTLGVPYLVLTCYAAYVLKDGAARHVLAVALVYTAYYLSVAPLMNVFSRYQWPIFVLLAYGSLPAIEWLTQNAVRRRGIIFVGVATILLMNLTNALAVGYFTQTTGTAMANLISMGKTMARYRKSDQWLAYHDAGAVCYYSDWDAYDTIGLATRDVALRKIDLEDIAARDHTAVILENVDMKSVDRQKQAAAILEKIRPFGYRLVSDVTVLREADRRHFVVRVFAKDVAQASAMVREMQLQPEVPPSPIYGVYRLARQIVKRH
jgi:arabinofuranosyltransferase